MPRLTPLRLLKILVLPWLSLFGLWLFLPSPPRSPATREVYIATTLTSGATLTTIHRWEHWADAFDDTTNNNKRLPRPNDGCHGLILGWRLEAAPESDSTLLHLGIDTTINITDTLVHARRRDGVFNPYLSAPLSVRIPVGDEDHVINMPWFHWPDQVMFHNYMYGFDYTVALRVYVPAPGVLEVWKDSTALWAGFPDVRVREADRRFSRLGTVAGVLDVKGGRASLRHLRVENLSGELVSRTFPLRWALLRPLAPVASIGFYLVELAFHAVVEAVPAVVLVGVVVLVACWVVLSRYQHLHRRREQRARVWGPNGPIYDNHDDDDAGSNWRGKKASSGLGQRFRISIFDGAGDDVKRKKAGSAGGRFNV